MRAGSRRPETSRQQSPRARRRRQARAARAHAASRKNPVSANPSAMSSERRRDRLRQERRQTEQPILPGRGGDARHRAAGLRRHIAEVILGAGRGAACEVEAEAELDQHLQFEAHHLQPRRHRIVEMLEHRGQMIVHLRMRIALRQQPAQRAEMGDAIDHMRRRQAARRHAGAAARPRNCPRCSSRRARQTTRTVLPGCSTGRSRVPPPPRTRPRWRP